MIILDFAIFEYTIVDLKLGNVAEMFVCPKTPGMNASRHRYQAYIYLESFLVFLSSLVKKYSKRRYPGILKPVLSISKIITSVVTCHNLKLKVKKYEMASI